MNLQNGYKIMYEDRASAEKSLKATKTNPTASDKALKYVAPGEGGTKTGKEINPTGTLTRLYVNCDILAADLAEIKSNWNNIRTHALDKTGNAPYVLFAADASNWPIYIQENSGQFTMDSFNLNVPNRTEPYVVYTVDKEVVIDGVSQTLSAGIYNAAHEKLSGILVIDVDAVTGISEIYPGSEIYAGEANNYFTKLFSFNGPFVGGSGGDEVDPKTFKLVFEKDGCFYGSTTGSVEDAIPFNVYSGDNELLIGK